MPNDPPELSISRSIMFQVVRFPSASLVPKLESTRYYRTIFLIFARAANSSKPDTLSVGSPSKAFVRSETRSKFLSDKNQLNRF